MSEQQEIISVDGPNTKGIVLSQLVKGGKYLYDEYQKELGEETTTDFTELPQSIQDAWNKTFISCINFGEGFKM